MYWEYEITDREFDELMFYISAKKALGIKVEMNSAEQEGVITINTLSQYWRYNETVENIREWIKHQHPERFLELERLYPNGKEWKV